MKIFVFGVLMSLTLAKQFHQLPFALPNKSNSIKIPSHANLVQLTSFSMEYQNAPTVNI